MTMTDLKTQIRHVPDFPKAGILFYDITTLLQDAAGFRAAIDSLVLPFTDQRIDLVVGIESRGFIFGAPVADRLGAGFAPVRKPGKLPSACARPSIRSPAPSRIRRSISSSASRAAGSSSARRWPIASAPASRR
jgi:adenine/guanine phosphoribosyltransferase-like PRPP-binding protein